MESPSPTDAEFQSRIRQQEVVAELGQQALETDDLDQLMRNASKIVAETLGNEYCKVLELLPGEDAVLLRQGVGWRAGLVGSATVPTDKDSQAGYTLVSEEPVIVDDLRAEERFSGPELLTSHDVVSGISAVIGSVEDPWGVLGTHSTEPREFTEHDANFVQSVANLLAPAVENKQTHDELDRYRTIVETVGDAIYVVDEDQRFTMVNQAAVELSGYSREEILGAHVADMIGEEDADRANELGKTLVTEDREVVSAEFSLSTGDGREVPIEARFTSLSSSTGSADRVGVARDITERKERERALEESERRYRALVENFPNGSVGLFDEDLRYTAVGGQLFDRLDFDAEDQLGQSITELHPPELLEEIRPYFHAALEGETNSFEAEFHDRHLHAITLPIKDPNDEVFAGMVVIQDVTERREYEHMLEQSNERLEQFAYAASHDLQEPLRMVSSYLKLVKQRYGDELDEDGQEFIEFAVNGADRMRNMIEGLLRYSRVETQGDAFETVDLGAVLDDVRDDLQVRVEETDAEITVEKLPPVHGDSGQLRQVFQNLLDNAIEYSGDDPPRIHVSPEPDGDEWVISVRDEGNGIDPDDADQVFEVFQSLHTPDEYDGTGIGLALCERIVERHGGEIWVESESGEGATFSFTLPTAQEGSDD